MLKSPSPTSQVLPYMRFANSDDGLKDMLRGVVMRQARSVLIDPYANAFNIEANGDGHQEDIRKPPMTPPVFEGKYELDSLAAFLKVSFYYWDVTRDDSIFTDVWMSAMELAVDTIEYEQQGTDEENGDPAYIFLRWVGVWGLCVVVGVSCANDGDLAYTSSSGPESSTPTNPPSAAACPR